jgi:hypothetical protein
LDAPATDVAGRQQKMLLVLAASNMTTKNATTETGKDCYKHKQISAKQMLLKHELDPRN